ncbi:PIG-X [Schizophyllum fasciatum]
MMSPPGSFEAWLSPAQGFHPTFKTTSKLNDAALLKECSLNLHFLLPATVFADRYELQNYAPRLQFEYRGPSNLELPVFALKAEEGAPELLVSVDLGGEGDDGPIEVDVPLHLRYGPVSALDSERHEAVEFPYPEAFLACPRTAGALQVVCY